MNSYQALPPEALEYKTTASGWLLFSRLATSYRFSRNLLMGDWPNFVRPQASLLGTPRQDIYQHCTPIIDGEASFSRTLKRYLRRSQASGPDRLKSKPVVQARERQANRDCSQVVGRGRINSAMLSLIALAWQKQLARSWQAASQPASQVGQVNHTTAFLVGTAFLARRSSFFLLQTENGHAKNNSQK
jgi:hypothetical protein